jgi:1,4-dihydroxy-2-naphthoate octaprenyltransferase
MNKTAAWIKAFRLRTLPLALSSIGMGSFLAAYQGQFHWEILMLSALTTIFLQVLSNLANDYGDFQHGIDSIHREGPSRTVQAGLIAPNSMKKALVLFAFLSFSSGILLLLVSLGWDFEAFVFFLTLGILAILAAIAYTIGKRPYGYLGLGDISVMIFFGLIGVAGTYFLHTKQFEWQYLLPALSCGFFSMAVLNVNNIRDIESDRKAGKFSVPVRLGRKKAVQYHWAILIAGISCAVIFVLIQDFLISNWLFSLSLPLILQNGLQVSKKQSAGELDPYLKQMALTTLVFVLTFGTGLLLGKI